MPECPGFSPGGTRLPRGGARAPSGRATAQTVSCEGGRGKAGAEDHAHTPSCWLLHHTRDDPGHPHSAPTATPLNQGGPHSLAPKDGDPSHPLRGLQGRLRGRELHQLPAGDPPQGVPGAGGPAGHQGGELAGPWPESARSPTLWSQPVALPLKLAFLRN